jgi:adenylyltransferase/sulfurtransferase
MDIETIISPEELKQWMSSQKAFQLLDVREDDEREDFNIGGCHIPLQTLPERINELNDKTPIVVYCRSGGRSQMACEFLRTYGFQTINLAGGTMGWQAMPHSRRQ